MAKSIRPGIYEFNDRYYRVTRVSSPHSLRVRYTLEALGPASLEWRFVTGWLQRVVDEGERVVLVPEHPLLQMARDQQRCLMCGSAIYAQQSLADGMGQDCAEAYWNG